VLLRDGAADRPALRAEQVRESELAGMLRLQGVADDRWGDVETVRLEPSGEASVHKRPAARGLRRRDLEAV
jgi:uncharacterized membrane protein YcaP (DUF421 family)